jgi:hypothetical protein
MRMRGMKSRQTKATLRRNEFDGIYISLSQNRQVGKYLTQDNAHSAILIMAKSTVP